MPWPFRKKKKTEVQEAPAQRNTLTAMNYAPIYKAQGGSMFDEFLKTRDEEGYTNEMGRLRPELSDGGSRFVNPELALIIANGLPQSQMEATVGNWGLNYGSCAKAWSKEPIEKKPVFETHSYFGKHMGAMHSFIGLRFTAVEDTAPEIYNEDPEIARLGLARKRIVVGYGHGETIFGSNSGETGGGGRLMDDSDHMITASTETPIDIGRARILVASVGKFHERFNYNLFTANCNDFAMTMSKLVGARVPAELYNHALGPVVAAGDMKKSAGKSHDGGTDLIKRRDIGRENVLAEKAERYQTEIENNDMAGMASHFEQDMKAAIVKDGGARRLPGIQAAMDSMVIKLNATNGIAAIRRQILAPQNARNPESFGWDNDTQDRYVFELLEDLKKQLTDVIESAKKIVTSSVNTEHPNVNKAVWKLIISLEEYYRAVNIDTTMNRMERRNRQHRAGSAGTAAQASNPPQSGNASSASATA